MNTLTKVVLNALLIGNALHAMQADVVKDAVAFRVHGLQCTQHYPYPHAQLASIDACPCKESSSKIMVEFVDKFNKGIKSEVIEELFFKHRHIDGARARLGSKPDVEYVCPYNKEAIEFFDRFNNNIASASSRIWSSVYNLVGGTRDEPIVALGDEAIQQVKPYVNNTEKLKNIRMFMSPADRERFVANQVALENKIAQRNRLGFYIAGTAIVGISGYILYKKWRLSQKMKKRES